MPDRDRDRGGNRGDRRSDAAPNERLETPRDAAATNAPDGVRGDDDIAARALDPEALRAHRRVSAQFKVAAPHVVGSPGARERDRAARRDEVEDRMTRAEAVFSPAFAPAPPRRGGAAALAGGLGFFGRVFAALGAPRAPGATTSVSLALLAGLAALYLGAAFSHALDHALRFAAPAAFAVSAATFLATLILNRYRFIRFEIGAGVILGLSFLLQVNFAAWTDPQPAGGLADLFNDARRLSAGLGAWDVDWSLLEASQSPAALGFYAISMATVGDDLSVLRVVSAGLWTLQGWLVWAIARRIAELRDRATLVVALFALNPTILLFGGLPSVEAVFGVFALASAAALFSHRARGLAISALMAGLFAAAAFMTKPLGLGVFAGLFIAIALSAAAIRGGWRRRAPALGAALALVAGFAIGLAPQAALHSARSGVFSVAPGASLGYQLLIGANYPGGGAYSEESASVDLARAGFGGADPAPVREADARATALALERIMEDPLRYAVFAATEKMRRIWSNEREMLAWTRDGAGGAPWASAGSPENEQTNLVQTLVDGVYLAFVALAALAALRLTFSGGAAARDPSRWLIIYGVVVATALTAAFMEARPLAHVGLLPFLALTAPLAVATTRRRRAAWQASTAEASEVATEDADATPTADSRPMGERPAEARLAHVLSRMSKPPRPAQREAPQRSDEAAQSRPTPPSNEESRRRAPPQPPSRRDAPSEPPKREERRQGETSPVEDAGATRAPRRAPRRRGA